MGNTMKKIVNPLVLKSLLFEQHWKLFRYEFSLRLARNGFKEIQKSSRIEHAINIIDQFKEMIEAFQNFPNLLNITEKYPDIVTKFLHEKTAYDTEFQKR